MTTVGEYLDDKHPDDLDKQVQMMNIFEKFKQLNPENKQFALDLIKVFSTKGADQELLESVIERKRAMDPDDPDTGILEKLRTENLST